MEQDRAEKAPAQVAGGGRAAVGSEKAQRQELQKGKAAGAADVATVRAAAAKAWVAARAEAMAAAVEQRTQAEKGKTTMPAGDGTGPMGMGPMTGRGMGFCAGVVAPGSVNMTPGRGFRLRQGYGGQVGTGCGRGFRGRGAGGGRGPSAGLRAGWRNMFYAAGLTGWQRAAAGWPMAGEMPPYAVTPTREQQLEALKGQAEYFEGALGDLRKRIEELQVEKADK